MADTGDTLATRLRRTPRWALRAGLATFAAQVGLAATITAVDKIRKQRTAEVHAVPRGDPREADVGGTAVTTYTYGEHLFEAMLDAIEGAQEYLYLATFIWKGDAVGQRFKDAIIAAAERGVTVCVVYDGFANLVVPREFKRFPDSVHVMRFPVVRGGIPIVDVRRQGRDHRKILVVDGKVGFVGGYNIGALYATQWRDTHVRLSGEGVWELQNSFVDFWNRHRTQRLPVLPDTGSPTWGWQVIAARNEPSRLLFPVRRIYLDAIDRASKRIWITQAYFIPDVEILDALLTAAARGVDVRVIMPEASNHVVADWVARSYFTRLLAGGVRIFLYENVMVHAKTATVDGEWGTVGTANIDRLSLFGNYEVNLEIRGREHARQLEEIFAADLANCRELTLAEWEERGLLVRATERFLAPLKPLL
ncbi:phospholipase D-like domain-containing protein [Ornithinicoccus halotolerans]|uniref:phospholipase D-like domain-containing protein n=1 Tax=Ornithinicoccus halotolerans TaxID=1748220 RepID=UPI001294E7DA|nr:phospholipase D-like domain-containing protein [Ornithinicoccus halotolerans]